MDDAPKYTIGRVAELVGIRPATLRAWERRYGFPRPARSAARYRLFSDVDLAWVRWVRDRIREGVLPRQAVWLALRRREAGLAPLAPADPSPESAKEELLAALMAFDGNRTAELLRHLSAHTSPERVVREVLLPAVAAVGAEWEAGRATVSQEHFASQIALRYLSSLLQGPLPAGPGVLCACAPGEQHQLGLLYVAAAARLRGGHVVYLGADTPAPSVLEAVERVRPRVVVVAAVVVDLAEAWRPYRRRCRALARRGVLWIWGGPGAASARRAGLPGRVAPTLDHAVRFLEGPLAAPARAG